MQASGPKHPCPACGRTKDADCRFTSDLILCHTGTDLKPGECITIDSAPWAFIRHNGGFSGQAAVFRPHRDNNRAPGHGSSRPDAQAKARQAIAAFSITRFYEAFQAAWDIPDLHSLTADELIAATATITRAQEIGADLSKNLQRLWREAPELKDLHRERVNAYLKNLAYQASDLSHFRSHYLGEVA